MYKTWALSFRPRDGITDEQVDALKTWVQNSTDYDYFVTEKSDNERHGHLGLWFSEPISKGNLGNRILSMPSFQSLDKTQQLFGIRAGIKPMYNLGWRDNYLDPLNPDKVADVDSFQLISSRYASDEELNTYFPDKNDDQLKRKYEGDPVYVRLEKLFYESQAEGHPAANHSPQTIASLRAWFYDMMFVDRRINVVEDPKRREWKVRALFRFMNKTRKIIPQILSDSDQAFTLDSL